MKLWGKVLLGAAVVGTAGFIAWRAGLLKKLRTHSQSQVQSQGLRPVMENEEVWDVESDDQGIPKRITIHRKVVG